MRLFKQPLLITAMLLSAGNAIADGDEPVDCEQVTVEIAYYAGWASCNTWNNGISHTISQYVQPRTTPTALLTENVNGQYIQCWANVPFSYYGQATGEVCKYTPKVEISEHRVDAGDGTYVRGKLVVNFESSDRDGNIVQEEVFIDGISVPVRFHELSVKPGQFSSTYNIRYKVTDNDGYETETIRNVIVSNLAICQGSGGFDSVCESEN